ncbi:MAG: secretin N-terminal domain-containing protein [Pseudomonadota bacterium]
MTEQRHMMPNQLLTPILSLLLLISLASCIANPNIIEGEEAEALLEAYRTQTELARQTQAQVAETSIRRLDVQQTERGGLFLSIDVVNADLSQVMSQILTDNRIAYRLGGMGFSGNISLRFDDKPLLDGLNLLLETRGIMAYETNGIIEFRIARTADLTTLAGEASQEIITREVELKHVTAADIETLITGLFPATDVLQSEPVAVGSMAERNVVYVSGLPDMVALAMSVIARADQPVAHVIIEALVVDINTSSVETLNISLADSTSGKFTLSSLVPGNTGGNIVATFSDLATNSAEVTATIDFLAARNAAEVLARPYIATRSTQTASIQIVDDQFVRVDTSNDDSSIISTDSVTAGITMQITPVVMANEAIRVDVALEDSRFGATAGDILITKQRNSASTSMIVKSGQTIMIGGLNSRYRISEHSGLPWVRNIPILSAFLAEQGALETRSELVVYLTPYVWVPGLDLPLPHAGTPSPHIPDWLSVETGQKPK